MLASTTRNVYGIYDLAGGNVEAIMAGRSSTYFTGDTMFTNSMYGFPLNLSAKYFDLYSETEFIDTTTSQGIATNIQYCTIVNCGGQALFEVNSKTPANYNSAWNSDLQIFAAMSAPYMQRGDSGYINGGVWTSNFGGIFQSNNSTVSPSGRSFRAILSKY